MNERCVEDQIIAETAELLRIAGLASAPTVTVNHPDAVLPSVFRVDTASAAAVAAVTAAVALVIGARGGSAPSVAVDGRAAQISFRSERYLTVDGEAPEDPWAALSGDYRSADGWVRVHANFDHHGERAAHALGVPPDRDALAAAIARKPAVEVEGAIIAAGGAAGALRSLATWADHPQGLADRAASVLRFERLDDAPARQWPTSSHREPRSGTGDGGAPLHGLRVLDLTRVIAGPVCGRVLSGHGADVLAVTAEHLPQISSLLPDVGLAKRSTFLDLRRKADRSSFDSLLADADVLVESFRPGALGGLGYDPATLASISPGLVVVDLRAYSSGGPFAERRGFDSLVQLVAGIADAGQAAAGADRPVPLPCQALDHGTGWLAALGALAALVRQRREGGSWRVEASLSATAAWLTAMGRCDGLGIADPGATDVSDLLVETPSDFGLVRHVALPGTLGGRPSGWSGPPPLLGSSPPVWRT